MSLTGKTAFITGAGSGIGRATCLILAREGANIIAADINEPNAKETVALIKNPDTKNISLYIDISNSSSVKAALNKTLETYKEPPSIVVNCAGVLGTIGPIITVSEDDFQKIMDVNLRGTFLVSQAFGKAIIENQVPKASIINVGSIVSKCGLAGQAHYAASKAGVECLTKTAAKEWGKQGIRVNVVLPGAVYTAMTSPTPTPEMEAFGQQLTLGRAAQPEEIGEVICFLASEKSSYITGACIEATGGWFN